MDCVKENLEDLGNKISDIVLVHQDLRNWDATADKVSQLGDFDGLVNCAGILEPLIRAFYPKVLSKDFGL